MSEIILEFTIKAAIAAAIFVIAIWIATGIVKVALTEQLDRLGQILRLEGIDHGAIGRVDRMIIRIGQADLPEQRQKEILDHIAFAGKKWRPFLEKVWCTVGQTHP